MRTFVKRTAVSAAMVGLVVVLSSSPAARAQSTPPGVPCLARSTAVIADTGQVTLNSQTLVDSYQSSLGPYGGSNVDNQGNVRAATSITVNSGAIVHGTLTPNSPAGLQVVQPPQGATQLGSVIVNSGQTLRLAGGSYVASSLTLNSASSLVVSSGQVLLWVTGSIVISGAANSGGPPANLQLLVTGTNDVNVNSGAVVDGILYAPAANVNVNATVFGSVVGGQVSTFNSGAQVHFDQNEACAATPPPVTVAAGNFGACAVRAGGTVECWGNNPDGQLGNGTSGNFSAVPVLASGLTGAVAVSQGDAHSCALLSGGTVDCWGDNAFGELGVGSTTGPQQCSQGVGLPSSACSTTPVPVPGVSGAVNVTAGDNHTCVVLGSGALQCWGDNSFGELGDGTTTMRTSPVTVPGVSHAVAVSAGAAHTCVVLSTGGVQCWGSNSFGELGDGTTTNRLSPVSVSGINSAIGVSAGFNFTCAVLSTGGVDCWGSNAAGQLGDGTNSGPSTCGSLGACSPTPVAVSGITHATAVGANGNSSAGHACALLSNGTVACWGENQRGELGDGTLTSRLTPVTTVNLPNASGIAVGGEHTCAALASGGVDCWGGSEVGDLGDGSSTGPDQCPDANNPCSFQPVSVSF